MDGPFAKKLEHLIDLLIPYALVLLIGILIIEFAEPQWMEEYPIIHYLDYLIVTIFIIDLLFKYHHSKTIPFFLKTYWLEIIAVFPFFLIFRLLDGLGLLTFAIGETAIKEGQGVVHATQGVSKEAEAVAKTLSTAEKEAAALGRTVGAVEKEAAAVGRLTRAQRLTRFIRPIFDSRKTLHVADFYEHPLYRKPKNKVVVLRRA